MFESKITNFAESSSFYSAARFLVVGICWSSVNSSAVQHITNFICSQVDNAAEKKAPEPEPTFQILTNPARVIPTQEKFIKFIEGSRYVPVKPAPSGFILLQDMQPTEAEVLALTDAPSTVAATTGSAAAATGQQASSAMAVDDEPQPPQPFEYTSWW